jgi:hypothetical protein
MATGLLGAITAAAHAATDNVRMDMKYEGGSLPLDPHDDLKVSPGTNIIITQGKKSFTIPASAVTEVSYGNDVHRRVGTAIGVGVLTLGIGAMLLLVKTKKHYVGMTWADAPGEFPKGGAVFKVGKGEYRGFLASLEGVTGKKAIDTDTDGKK